MHLIKVLGLNVKVPDMCYDLEPVTIFVGKSESGKTAVMNAIRAGLLGYESSLGKRNSDTFLLARGSQMQTGLEFDDKRKLSRAWSRNGNGSVEATVQRDEVKLSFPEMLFSPASYFALSAKERLATIFNLCALSDARDHQSEIIAGIRGLKLETSTAATEAALTELLAAVTKHAEECDGEGLPTQEWLSLLLELLTQQLKDARGLVKAFSGHSESDSHMRAAEGKLQQPESVESQLPGARERLQTLEVEAQGISDKAQERQRAVTRLATIKAELLKLPASIEQVATISQERLKELREGVAGMEAKLESEVRQRVKNHRQLHSVAQAQLEALVLDMQELQVEIAEAAGHDACPYCKSKSKGWRKHLEAAHKKASDDLKAQIYKQQCRADSLTKELATLVSEEADFVTALRVNKAEIEKAVDVINANAKAAAAGATRAKLEGEQKALLDSLPPEPLPGYLAALDARLKGARGDVAGLEQKQNQWLAHKAGQVAAAKALEQRERAEARVVVMKAALESVTEAQAKLVADSVAKVMETAGMFMAGLLPHALEYREGDIGYFDGGVWVSHETFSGTRKALAFAGLAIALAAESPFKLVMMDELGIVDKSMKRAIIARLVQLIYDGQIDQAICADSNMEDWDEPMHGVHVIKVQ